MRSEKFIKLGNDVYYESQLELMSNNQLNDLIKECQDGIEEIEEKKNDYKLNNTEAKNSNHFWDVVKKFESAQVYLQSDIILISKILKNREPENDPLIWYEKFFDITMMNLPSWKKNKFVKATNDEVGFCL